MSSCKRKDYTQIISLNSRYYVLLILSIFLLYFISNKANNYLLYRSPLKSFHQFRKAGGNGGSGGNLNNNLHLALRLSFLSTTFPKRLTLPVTRRKKKPSLFKHCKEARLELTPQRYDNYFYCARIYIRN